MKQIIILCLGILLIGCNKNSSDAPILMIIPECKGAPKYLTQAGFLPGKPFGFSIAERGVTGLALVQFPGPGVPHKQFVMPDWDKAGHLGGVITDKDGNSYVIPRPFINTLKNDPADQNTLFRIDSHTGSMNAYIKLPGENTSDSGNPFGLMGVFLDCETEVIYTSSISGSTAIEEKGRVYALSTGPDPEVFATLSGMDVMGLAVYYQLGHKYLLLGKARTSDVYRIELNKKGGFIGEPEKVLSLELLGDRGDDKPRKIRFSNKGELMVSGINFNFNLANTPDKQENIYSFQFDQTTSEWKLAKIQRGIM
jgi:hypothetical protein